MDVKARLAVATIFATIFELSGGFAVEAGGPGGPPCVKGQPGRGGVVTEHSREPNTTFIIHLTDFDYNVIPGQDIHPPSIPDGHGGTTINPVTVPAMDNLCDARNETIKPVKRGGKVGPKADLSIESVFFDQNTNKFELLNIWGTIAQQLGRSAVIAIPDLYASDALGALDDTTLFSLVDLSVYLQSIPLFTEGEVFNIVNGQDAALPGMFFSTTPFTIRLTQARRSRRRSTASLFRSPPHSPYSPPASSACSAMAGDGKSGLHKT